MTLPIKCKHCSEIVFIDEQLNGLEDYLKLNVCDECEDYEDDEE